MEVNQKYEPRSEDSEEITPMSAPRGRRQHGSLSSRISVPEIARRLDIGRLAVYTMLEQGLLPGIRLGRRWIVTRHAFENWERTCGMATGLQGRPEHKVT